VQVQAGSPSSPDCGSACLRWNDGVHYAFASHRSCRHAVQRAACWAFACAVGVRGVRACVLTDSVHFRFVPQSLTVVTFSRATSQWLIALSCCSVDMGALMLKVDPTGVPGGAKPI